MPAPSNRIALALATLFLAPAALPAAEPATVAQASETVDLVTLPLIDGGQLMGRRREASLSYTTRSKTTEAFEFVDKQLTDRGFQQLPGAQSFPSQGFASADYRKSGFLVHLSVYPHGDGFPAVKLSHKGNLPLTELPTPEGAEKLYGFVSTLMYKTAAGVPETAKACREKMLAAGWSPYGSAGDVQYYRNNAVLAHVRVMSAPGQGGATVINYSTELLSLEIPAPAFAEGFRYSDGTSAILFDCNKTPQQVADFYRDKLASTGWVATTDQPVEIEWRKVTIFRNELQEMITIETHDFEGRTRVKLNHKNAAEVAQKERLAHSAAGEKAKYRNKKWVDVPLTLPGGLTAKQEEKWAVTLATPQSGAFETAEKLAASLTAAGWRAAEPPTNPIFRKHRLERADKTIWLLAVQPPKRPAWVAVVGTGGVNFEPSE